ncbi:arad-like aldolase/epimerase [Myriangium duriaei CBS 260.36]|uniref:Arad-like aldolase/epimerase n=1 Tax=Myriangium duriaei CBS 260.36 TaxID=1168546 RepID=A0A9P4IV29_9PEZI|nr:arad-like aldolase/epimerase [Myriangium duriaei CBS 260.36]
MSTTLPSRLRTATTPIPDTFFSTLITAGHILHSHSILDGYGHVSARSPQNPSTFYLSAARAPALVSRRSDIVEYRVSDGEAVSSDSPRGFLERYIHSEIYKRWPGVQAVVHGHAEDLVVFGATSVPLKVVGHMGGVQGASVPVFDIADHYSSSARHDMLITSTTLGGALAASFAPQSLLGKTGNVLKSFLPIGEKGEEGAETPPHGLVLMRGHGFTALGGTVEEAVYRSVYAVANAKIQYKAMTLQGAANMAAVGERVAKVGEKGYESAGDKGKLGEVKYLSDRETKDAWEANKGQASRPWELWTEEVRWNGLYRNEYWDAEENEDDKEEENEVKE